jgi:uncharacterized surface protein with fasciclin (FAS1) repeats
MAFFVGVAPFSTHLCCSVDQRSSKEDLPMNILAQSTSSHRAPFWLALPLAVLLVVGLAACGGGQEQEQASDQTETEAPGTIAEIASNDSRFSTLVTALDSAGLVQTMQEDGPFTVFAPTNAAFDALPDGTVEDLLQPENRERLTEILTYHVVEGANMASDVQGMSSATTLQGSDVSISTSDGSVQVGGATVVQADVEASNGVIHAIDAVLMPPSGDESM